MPKLKKPDIARREEFVRGLFRKNPKLAVGKVNDALKKEFESAMRTNRVYEIRKEFEGGVIPRAAAPKNAPAKPITSAARAPAAISTTLPQVVKFSANESAADVLDKTLRQLRAAGLTNLEVSHKTETYAIIDAAS